MSEVRRPRRYYLLKRLALAARGEYEQSLVFKAKQEFEPGTSLPVGFPHSAALVLAGYAALEDIDGADSAELQRAGFDESSALRILIAAQAEGV
jgi:hypothetical protein